MLARILEVELRWLESVCQRIRLKEHQCDPVEKDGAKTRLPRPDGRVMHCPTPRVSAECCVLHKWYTVEMSSPQPVGMCSVVLAESFLSSS